jgi:hypothetical protein
LGGADRQCMAEAEQQPARFVEPAPFRFDCTPVFVSQDQLGVGAELRRASIGQGGVSREPTDPSPVTKRSKRGSWDVRVRVVRNRRVEQVGLADWPMVDGRFDRAVGISTRC